MAINHINVFQVGEYKDSKGVYRLEIYKTSTKDMYNFIDAEGRVITSVYTDYKSKAVGVKTAGAFEREVFGDFELYLGFINFLNDSRQKYFNNVNTSRSIEISEDGYFVDVLENKSDKHYAKQTLIEGNILDEIIEDFDKGIYVKYECIEKGKKVKLKKVKGLEYRLRDKGENDNIKIPIKTLDMLSLEKDLSWLEGKNYKILNTKEDFEAYLKKLHNYDGLVGFDTETTGLNINRFPIGHPQRDELVGICLSIDDNEGVYIPIKQRYFNNLDEDYVIEKLRPYIDKNGEYKKDLVTHNGKFDWKVMFTYGIELNITHDSFILQYLLNNSTFNKSKALSSLAKQELGMDMIELDEIFLMQKGVKLKVDFSYVTYEIAQRYAPADADATRLLVYKKLEEMPRSMAFIYWVEIELMKYLGKIEYYGIRLDIPLVIKQKEEAEKRKAEVEQEIYDLVGREFNINSNKELPQIMYEELKYPVLERTKKGAPSTGKRALSLLKSKKDKDGNHLYPLAVLLAEYKAQEKLLNGFLNKMLAENVDGYIFPSYNQTGTESGRISCSEPNLQQTPGSNRAVIIPDSDEYYFIVADYSQVEYRLMAGFGGELDIIESFKDPDTDHHTIMYAKMFGIHPDEVTSKERNIGKMLNFGITYGMGPFSLAIVLFNNPSDENVKEAKELTNAYFGAVPNIYRMLEETKDKAFIDGYVETKFHRRRYFPDIRSKDGRIRAANRRKAANTKIQGTGADIIKIAHVKVEREIEKRGLDAHVKISMHDELVTMVHKSINPWYMIKLLRECMEMEIEGFPPLFIGANVGDTWAVGKRDDLEIPIRLTEEMFAKGEHLKEGYEDPEAMVGEQIKEYVFNRLKNIIQERNLDTVEKALNFPAVEKLLKDYFGDKDKEEMITNIFEGKDIDLGGGYVIYNDGDLEFNDYDDIDSGDMDFEGVKRLYNEGELELEGKDVKTAQEVMQSDYRVKLFDMKCFIQIDKVTKGCIEELKDYLDKHNAPSGYSVVLDNNGEHFYTKYKLYKVDKIALLKILDKYTLV